MPIDNADERTILFIEDSELNVTLVERVLRSSTDLRLRITTTAREALETASREPCDLILTDLNLPDLSGEVLLATLREHPATRHLPVVVMSGEDTPELDERVRAAGALALVRKPYAAADLIATIRRALQGDLGRTVAGPAAPNQARPEPLFDRLRRTGSDDLGSMVAGFAATSSREMAEVRVALDAGDTEQVRFLAHRLLGSLALFGATTAAERMGELVQLAASGTLDGADSLLAAAQDALDRYLDEIRPRS